MCAIVGAAVSAAGALMQGMAGKEMADYNAKVAKLNARSARAEGQYKSEITRKEYDAVAASQRVAVAKAGVSQDSGSADMLALEQSKRTEHAAALDIWQGRSEGVKYDNEAAAQKAAGKASMMQGILGAAGAIVGGIGGAVKSPGAGGLGVAAPAPTGLGTATPITSARRYGGPLMLSSYLRATPWGH